MAENSKIEWTDHTLNFWIGCQEVSPACDHCYAKTQNEHWKWVNGWGPNGERRRTSENTWHQLRLWNKRAKARGIREKVFSNSLSDFFDNRAQSTWRREAWHYIDQCEWLDFLILTKRPQNIPGMLPDPETGTRPWGGGWPNVWLGTTAENQAEADRRIPHLLAVPARARFVSCEPLLGALDLRSYLTGHEDNGVDLTREIGSKVGATIGWTPPLDWVIVGGESGPNARPMHPGWARNLRDQCQSAGVAFFFKQWGEWAPSEDHPRVKEELPWSPTSYQGMCRVGKRAAGAMLDGREWREMPA
jgi:protein gp37